MISHALKSLTISFLILLSFCLVTAYISGGLLEIRMIAESAGFEWPATPIVFDKNSNITLASESAHVACSRIAANIEWKVWPAYGSYSEYYLGLGTYWNSSPGAWFRQIFGQRLPDWFLDKYIGENELRSPLLHAFLSYPVQFILPGLVLLTLSLTIGNLSRKAWAVTIALAFCVYCLVFVYPFRNLLNGFMWHWSSGDDWRLRYICSGVALVLYAFMTMRISKCLPR